MFKDLTFLQAKKVQNASERIRNVAVLRDITIESMQFYLNFFASKEDIKFNFNFSSYGNLESDLMTTDLINPETNFVLYFRNLEFSFEKIFSEFYQMNDEEKSQAFSTIVDEFIRPLKMVREKSNAPIIYTKFQKHFYSSFGIGDNVPGGLNEFVEKLNSEIAQNLKALKSVYALDLDVVIARLGHDAFFERERKFSVQMPFSLNGQRELAIETFKYLRGLTGLTKKVLVLDCDNTIWGGVIGEDGLDGIVMSDSFTGTGYSRFQKFAKDLSRKGVLVCLCSKNNEADVWEAFEKNSKMILKREDIVAYKINWTEKADNLKALASELNLGIDSFVFVDDSGVELEKVKNEIPQLITLKLNVDDPTQTIEDIIRMGYFDSLNISTEDRERVLMYKGEVMRKAEMESSQDFASFLGKLELELKLYKNNTDQLPRVHQLIHKTNQFNLTTKRYSEGEIEDFMNSKDWDVFTCSAKDKYGDLGLIAVCLVKKANDVLDVDNFLMSCRAMGRQVENAFLYSVLSSLCESGSKKIHTAYLPTKKNAVVKNYYEGFGFKLETETEAGTKTYVLNSNELNFEYKQLINIIWS